MNIDEILDEMEDLVNTSPTVPFTGHKILIDGERLRDLIEDIRVNIPQEIQRAKVIDVESDRIIKEAELKAEAIVKRTEERAKAMISNDEIMRQAKQKAIDILTQAQSRSKEIKNAGNSYVNNVLSQTEEYLTENLREVRQTKQKFAEVATTKNVPQNPEIPHQEPPQT